MMLNIEFPYQVSMHHPCIFSTKSTTKPKVKIASRETSLQTTKIVYLRALNDVYTMAQVPWAWAARGGLQGGGAG